jgi:hypothetical protein
LFLRKCVVDQRRRSIKLVFDREPEAKAAKHALTAFAS